MEVYLSTHATEQLEVLGRPAVEAVERLRSLSLEDVEWLAEPMPPQRGREVWLLWDREVRILFDVEGTDVTVQGIGLRPPPRGSRHRAHRLPR